jgi:hypothetical protein
MSENQTTTSPETVVSSEPVIIPSTGGRADLRAFKEASGLNKIVDADDDGDDSEENSNDSMETSRSDDSEESQSSKKSLDESQDDSDESESDDEGEDQTTDLEEISKEVKGKGISLKTKDGKVLKLPMDATIMHKVDGVLTEINLQQAINREVGELTIEQRLTKTANLEHTLKTKLKQVEEREAEEGKFVEEIANLAASDKPELAFVKLCEKNNQTPGQAFKMLINKGLEWAKKIESQGLTEKDIEAYCTQVDRDYFKQKIEDKNKSELSTKETQNLERLAHEAVQKYKVTDEEFDSAVESLLAQEGAFAGLSPEQKIDKVMNVALGSKHTRLVDEALKGTGLEEDAAVRRALFRVTDPIEFSVEDIREIAIASKSQSVATKLPEGKTVKGQAIKQNVGAKTKQEVVKVMRPGDIRRQFGL